MGLLLSFSPFSARLPFFRGFGGEVFRPDFALGVKAAAGFIYFPSSGYIAESPGIYSL